MEKGDTENNVNAPTERIKKWGNFNEMKFLKQMNLSTAVQWDWFKKVVRGRNVAEEEGKLYEKYMWE